MNPLPVNPIAGVAGAVSEVADAAGKIADVVKQRSEQENTADQRANAEAAQMQADRDKVRKDIAAEDQTELEKDVAP